MGQTQDTLAYIRGWIEDHIDELFELHKGKFYIDMQNKMNKKHFILFNNDFHNEQTKRKIKL